MKKMLHIVSFNIPFPADYGGVIDVYYKIKALRETGAEIILHCFEYGRKPSRKLNELCKEVHYYKRPKGFGYTLKKLPFIVATRNSQQLLKNLLKNKYPILFEGLHSTYFIPQLIQTNRKLIVRAHNIEHDYYKGLAKAETRIFKKKFFQAESKKLTKYETVLNDVSAIAPISMADQEYFNATYGKSTFVSAFHPYNRVDIKPGLGKYVLFHGNLTVPDNIKSVLFLVNEVFSKIQIPFVIAGKNPDLQIVNAVKAKQHIQIVANPSEKEMDALLSGAQIHILTTFQQSGIKLKLLAALYRGRHCVVNKAMVNNTGLESLCHISESSSDLIKVINELFNVSFDLTEISRRKQVLRENFSNKVNAEKLMKIIFS